MHPNLPNDVAESWAAGPSGGSPGQVNASYVPDSPPIIRSIQHAPLVPTSSQSVTVLAEVFDEGSIDTVSLFSRTAGGSFESIAMLDDGLHGDTAAGDRIYGESIPGRHSPP